MSKSLDRTKEFLNECGWIGYTPKRIQWFDFDKLAEVIDKIYVHKKDLPTKDDLVTFLVERIVDYQKNKRFKFNARMSGKNWTLANWLAKDLRKLIMKKKQIKRLKAITSYEPDHTESIGD